SFLDELFGLPGFPDFPHALNGLQVGGSKAVSRVGAAVDASEETILAARENGMDLLVVHHGLFWEGMGPLTGPRLRKVAALLEGRLALYSVHLPLDAHPELGNAAILARRVGLEPEGPFGAFQEVDVGWWASAELGREELRLRLVDAVEGEVRLIPGGPQGVRRIGILTGGGASALPEAAASGLDTLITGEGAHHTYHQAMELEINLYLAGHYATETFGVKAVASRLEEKFGLPWEFLHFPTGL
ncbi:Nif3-like dinuclear metal center hexameric protein, partial [Gemmatimonadota bacterium]